MTDRQTKRNRPLRPAVPVINVEVSPADTRRENTDLHVVDAGWRLRNLFEPEAPLTPALDQCLHTILFSKRRTPVLSAPVSILGEPGKPSPRVHKTRTVLDPPVERRAPSSFRAVTGPVDSLTINSGSTRSSRSVAWPASLWSSVCAAISPIFCSGCRTVVRLGTWYEADWMSS